MKKRSVFTVAFMSLLFINANAQDTFNFVIETTASPQTFSFHVYDALNFEIDWGEGEGFQAVPDGSGLRSHVYDDADEYTIKVRGQASRIAFYGGTPALLRDITSKLSDGVTGITSAEAMFRGCAGITVFHQSDWFDDTAGNITTMREMFRDASNFNCPGIENWDTSEVTILRAMFQGATVFNRNINTKTVNEGTPDEYIAWNVSKVTTLGSYAAGYFGTFYNAAAFNQPLDKWDTSNVTHMESAFFGASAFNQPLEDWDTSKVTTMRMLFNNASSFDQDIGDWDTSKVNNMRDMFLNATSFNNGGSDGINNWDVSNVTTMYRMFGLAASFNQPIGRWNTSKVTTMQGMFDGASIFNRDISTKTVNEGMPDEYVAWDVSSVENFGRHADNRHGMFKNAVAFNQDIGNWDTSSATLMNRMFEGAVSFNQDISGWDVSNVEDFVNFLSGASAFSGENYDKLLTGWSLLTLQDNLSFRADPAYSLEGAGGRVTIIKNHGWTFTDGGLEALAEYEVGNPMELQGCAMHPEKTYKLVSDIDLSETGDWNDGAGFWPIGTETEPFAGTFDGHGHVLSELHIDRDDLDYVGLFGKIAGGTVRNLGVMGSVSGGDRVGGFAGLLGAGAEIEDCFARVSVTAASDTAHRGGFIGRNDGGAIRRVYSTGQVSPAGGGNGGGLAGSADGGEDTANFWDAQTSGWDTSAMGTGKTSREMRAIVTFRNAAWNIESTYDEANDGYPYLTGEADPVWLIYTAPQGTVFSLF